MKYRELFEHIGKRIKARQAAKYKTTYPRGRVFQTDDLYGETVEVRPEKWYEGIIIEMPRMKNGIPHATKKILFIETSDGKKYNLTKLRDFELIC